MNLYNYINLLCKYNINYNLTYNDISYIEYIMKNPYVNSRLELMQNIYGKLSYDNRRIYSNYCHNNGYYYKWL